MHPSEKELLLTPYQQYLETGNRECGLRFDNQANKFKTYNYLDNLEDDGYIEYIARATGFCQYKITPYGIQFVENDFKIPDVSPVIQGDNSIYINGSSNSITGNYNKISVDIAHSNLPDDCKQLIESLLYEMQNPHLPQEKKSEKIKSFLSDISSGTISGAAASGLTTLLISLFSQIPF